MDWAPFLLEFLVFFLSHSIPVRPPVKPWLVLNVRIGKAAPRRLNTW